MDQKGFRRVVEPIVENVLRTLFFWTRNDQEFGNAVVILHKSLLYLFIVAVIIINVVPVPHTLIIFMLILSFAILIQHLVLGVCVLSTIEKRVLGAPYPLMEPILELFKIPVSVESLKGVTVLILSMITLSFLLQVTRIWIQRK
jgi:hypothetical protein